MIKKYLLIFTFLIASLYISTSFAVTPEECNQLVNSGTAQNTDFDVLKLKDANIQKLIECGSPEGAKIAPLSPLSIFQLITNYIAYMAFALSIIAMIVSIIQIATSAGDKTKYQSATDLLKNAVVAFIISLSAYSILNISLDLIGFGSTTSSGGGSSSGTGSTGSGGTVDPTTIINRCTASSSTSSECTTILVNYSTCTTKIPTYEGYCRQLFCSTNPKPAGCPTTQ